MTKEKINTQFNISFTEEMIPEKLKLNLRFFLFLLGMLQNCCYYVIMVALDDLDKIFKSRSTVIICLG